MIHAVIGGRRCMEHEKSRASLSERILIVVAAWFLRALGRTLRFEYQGGDAVAASLAMNSATILFGWHEFFLIACCEFRHLKPFIMVSQSRDGEWITRIAERFGLRVVRGSSSRGGMKALLQMVRALQEPVLAGHLVDGPRGPRREIKTAAVILMAQRSRAVLIPSVYGVRHKWSAPSWDRLQIPFPFAKIVRRDLPARCVSEHLTPDDAEKLRVELHEELTRATDAIEAELGCKPAPQIRRS